MWMQARSTMQQQARLSVMLLPGTHLSVMKFDLPEALRCIELGRQ